MPAHRLRPLGAIAARGPVPSAAAALCAMLLAPCGCGPDERAPAATDVPAAAAPAAAAGAAQAAAGAPAADILAGRSELAWNDVLQLLESGNPGLSSARALVGAAEAFHRRLATGASLAGLHAAQAHLAAARRELELDARTHFAELWLAGRSAVIERAMRTLLGSLVGAAGAAANGGGDPRAVLEAQALLDSLERDLLATGREGQLHAQALNVLLGRAPLAALPSPAALLAPAAPPPAAALSAWAAGAPMVLAARAHRREAEANLALAERSIYPQPTMMAPGEEMFDFPPRAIPEAERAAVIAQWRAQVRARAAEQQAAELAAEQEVQGARTHLEECLSTLALLRHQDEVEDAAAALARSGFANGTVPLSTVVLAERALLTVRLSQASAERDAWSWDGVLAAARAGGG